MRLLLFILMSLSLLLGGCSQSAQPSGAANFPEKPIQLIVPTPAGGSTDTIARVFAKVVPKYLPNGQSVVVVNKPGGSNTIGVSEVYKSKPDGYTLGFIPSSTITSEPHFGNTPYTHYSFQTVMRVYRQDGFLYVKADAPWKNFEEWMAYVKQNPQQFKVATVAGAKGLLERLNHDAGIQMKIVPFDGFAPAVTGLLGGHVQGTVAIPSAVKSQLESGEIRPLFTSSGTSAGDIPTLKEKGFSIEENKLSGIIAPKGLPQEELTILHDAFKKAIEDLEVIKQFKNLSLEPYYGSPEEFQKDLTNNFTIDGETLRLTGLIK